MNISVARLAKVAIIGESGTYGTGILVRTEEIGVEAVVVTRSPHKFEDVRPTTRVVEAELVEEEKLKEAFVGCDGVISALGDDRKNRPKTHNLSHVWKAMKAADVTKYIGMVSEAMMMPGEKHDGVGIQLELISGLRQTFFQSLTEKGRKKPTDELVSLQQRYVRGFIPQEGYSKSIEPTWN